MREREREREGGVAGPYACVAVPYACVAVPHGCVAVPCACVAGPYVWLPGRAWPHDEITEARPLLLSAPFMPLVEPRRQGEA